MTMNDSLIPTQHRLKVEANLKLKTGNINGNKGQTHVPLPPFVLVRCCILIFNVLKLIFRIYLIVTLESILNLC